VPFSQKSDKLIVKDIKNNKAKSIFWFSSYSYW